MKKILPLPTGHQRTDEARERWIHAACQGHLTSEQLGEKLGISATEAQAIVDACLQDAIEAVVDSNRDQSS